MKTNQLDVSASETHGAGGFLALRRCRLRHWDGQGAASPPFVIDVVERSLGTDAVVVLPFARRPDRVLLRRGLRPALRLGRAQGLLREGTAAPLLQLEAVAGVVERDDKGAVELLRRAALELHEEAGLQVAETALRPLGPPAFLSPGLMAERIYFFAVEAALTAEPACPPAGDGSPFELGATLELLELDEALARCGRGEIEDLKTECALRRLAQWLVG
ncbi:MAG: NUDIX hydrolase [Proteobacteria bacterium]|nr:NUDIX hydrolase [Pseudomonadota bacterium]